jgi:hypothetical protein
LGRGPTISNGAQQFACPPTNIRIEVIQQRQYQIDANVAIDPHDCLGRVTAQTEINALLNVKENSQCFISVQRA